MSDTQQSTTETAPHRDHDLLTIHLFAQKAGVPYEVEQVRCIQCEQVVEERKQRLHA